MSTGPNAVIIAPGVRCRDFISQKVFTKSFCTSQFPHKFVKLSFMLVIIKDKWTDLLGN